MSKFALHLPINGVSFGQVSMGLLQRLFELGHEPCLFPIGPVDISAYNTGPEFNSWLQNCLIKGMKKHKRDVPIFKLWHFNGSLESFSDKQLLLTFYELDCPTEEEVNIIKNNRKVLVTNKYAQQIFEMHGCDNISTIKLFFDEKSFKIKEKKYFDDGRITFNVVGKFERRKNHEKLIRAWIKKYGNNPQYFLNCSIFNPFISNEDNQKIWFQIMGGQKFYNVNFIGFMPKNELYNDYLNSADVVIGMGTEGWGLPEFHSVGLGKHAVLLNCAGYKEWADNENAVLVTPNQKFEVYDGLFFHKGQPFNQGNIFSFDDDEFIHACEQVILRVTSSRKNVCGLKLQQKFTVDNTLQMILSELEKI